MANRMAVMLQWSAMSSIANTSLQDNGGNKTGKEAMMSSHSIILYHDLASKIIQLLDYCAVHFGVINVHCVTSQLVVIYFLKRVDVVMLRIFI
jgi:hypothetical protein